MSVDMTKWCELAKENIGKRPAGTGRLAGKICIVTGAAQGFGKGIAEELHKEGATIVIADLNEPLAKEVAANLGERAAAIAVNVADEASVANMVAQTVELYGGLDLMLSNAGVVRAGPVAELEKKDFDFVTSINYGGFFLCAKYAAIIMEAQHEADPDAMFDIIELNSKSGLEGSNKNCAYAAAAPHPDQGQADPHRFPFPSLPRRAAGGVFPVSAGAGGSAAERARPHDDGASVHDQLRPARRPRNHALL